MNPFRFWIFFCVLILLECYYTKFAYTLFARVIATVFMNKACGSAFLQSTGITNHCDWQKNDRDLQDRDSFFTQKGYLRRSHFYKETCSRPRYLLRFLCRTQWLAVSVFCRKVDARALFIGSVAVTRANTASLTPIIPFYWPDNAFIGREPCIIGREDSHMVHDNNHQAVSKLLFKLIASEPTVKK